MSFKVIVNSLFFHRTEKQKNVQENDRSLNIFFRVRQKMNPIGNFYADT